MLKYENSKDGVVIFQCDNDLASTATARAKSQLSESVVERPFASGDEGFLANIFDILMTVICRRSAGILAT